MAGTTSKNGSGSPDPALVYQHCARLGVPSFRREAFEPICMAFARTGVPMAVDYFRIPPGQTDLSHVVIVADDGKMRAVGRISRDIIEDIAPNEDYRQKRL